jgi:site-specific DNA-methyltransferase (adenine-specific)
MKTNHKIIIGDSREVHLKPNSVHLIVTSPPYWNIKDYEGKSLKHTYKKSKQIGFGESYRNYLESLKKVFQNCFFYLHEGCYLCVNIGDKYLKASERKGKYKKIPISSHLVNLLEEIGFEFIETYIWRKIGNCNSSGGSIMMGSYGFPRNGYTKINYEYIHRFRKAGNDPKVSKERKKLSRIGKNEWKLFFNDIWEICGSKNNDHPASFPLEIPKRLIKMFSFVGDKVLDPFLGSGTTMKACRQLKRNSVGIELNKNYLKTIKKRTNFSNMGLFNDCQFQVQNELIQ